MHRCEGGKNGEGLEVAASHHLDDDQRAPSIDHGSPFGQVPITARGGNIGAAPRQEMVGWTPPSTGITLSGTSGMSPLDAMSAMGIAPQLIRAGRGFGLAAFFHIAQITEHLLQIQ